MSKTKATFFLILSFFLFSSGDTLNSSALTKRIQKKVAKEVKAIFSVEDFELSESTITIPSSPFLLGQQMNEIKVDDELLGYAFLGTAPSKTDTFEYLILFDPSFTIKSGRFVKFINDSHGDKH